MTWPELINSLISENLLSVNAFARRCHLHHTTVLNLMSEKTSTVQLRTKMSIEQGFGITIDDSDPQNLIVVKAPNSESRISTMVNNIIEKYGGGAHPKGNYVLGTVTAGRGQVLDYETEMIEELDYPVDTCFWYVIDKHNGDSMYPFLVEGDKILVDRSYPSRKVKDTDLVLVQYSGKGSVKFFSRSEEDANVLVFYSSNGNVPPLVLRKENCEYFKVVLIKKI